jgi:ubiquinone/menaquinone biosynthesis C-methylase UbiE
MPALYDAIGVTYGTTRRADPGIVRSLARYVQPTAGGNYLDLGCGTGNYTCALALPGGSWHGVDPSLQMLVQAKCKSQSVSWTLGQAESLPYGNDTFDGVVCTLAIHHFAALESSFAEVFRVLRRGRFVLFTAFPEQMRAYWLCHYFPTMMERSWSQMPSEALVVSALCSAGFSAPKVSAFEVTNELQDLFLYSGKHRPSQYLDAEVRANISSFAVLCPAAELEHGLESLRGDVSSDRFREVAKGYAGKSGDYAFVHVSKPGI